MYSLFFSSWWFGVVFFYSFFCSISFYLLVKYSMLEACKQWNLLIKVDLDIWYSKRSVVVWIVTLFSFTMSLVVVDDENVNHDDDVVLLLSFCLFFNAFSPQNFTARVDWIWRHQPWSSSFSLFFFHRLFLFSHPECNYCYSIII